MQSGRRNYNPQALTPAQKERAERKARVEQQEKQAQEKRELEQKLAQAEHQNRLLSLWNGVEANARRRAAEVALSASDTTRVVREVESAWQTHIATDKRPEHFDYVHAIQSAVAARSGGLAPAPRDRNPLTSQLPPLVSTLPANATAEQRKEAYDAAQERGRLLVEQNRASREAYRAALKKYGLTDPSTGSPTNSDGGVVGR
jgi:hypothetical protein